jgi:hypothetical protein
MKRLLSPASGTVKQKEALSWIADRPDAPTMSLDDAAGDGEPQTSSLLAARIQRLNGLNKPFAECMLNPMPLSRI